MASNVRLASSILQSWTWLDDQLYEIVFKEQLLENACVIDSKFSLSMKLKIKSSLYYNERPI